MKDNRMFRWLVAGALLSAAPVMSGCEDDNGDPQSDATDTDTDSDGDAGTDTDTVEPTECTQDNVETCLNPAVTCDPADYDGLTKDDYEWPDEVDGNDIDTCDHYAMPDCDGLSDLFTYVNTEDLNGKTICFTDALYVFDSALNLGGASNVTLVGMGDGYDVESQFPDDGSWDRTLAEKLPEQGLTTAEGWTRLDFSNLRNYQFDTDEGECRVTGAAKGIATTPGSSEVMFRDFAAIDSPGDAIETSGITNVSFIGVTTQWTAESCEENGAYGIYPVKSTGVLIEHSVVDGSADAGVYVGQSDQVLVRRSVAFRNVAGIEIENTTNAEVTETYAYDNTGGMLIFNLPGIEKSGYATRLHNNNFSENNWTNFADPNTSVGAVPSGTGIMILANDYNEVFDNHVLDNRTAGVLTVHYSELLKGGSALPSYYNAYAEANCIHDNVIDDTTGTGPLDEPANSTNFVIAGLWLEERGAPAGAETPGLTEGGCERNRPRETDCSGSDDQETCERLLSEWNPDDKYTYDIPGSDSTFEDPADTYEHNQYFNNVDLDGDDVAFASVALCGWQDEQGGDWVTMIDNQLGVRVAEECEFTLPCQTGRDGEECTREDTVIVPL